MSWITPLNSKPGRQFLYVRIGYNDRSVLLGGGSYQSVLDPSYLC